MLYLVILILGLIIGSFLNVCIYRIPKGKSVFYPSSHCEACGTSLKAYDLIPVFSWLLLGRRCRYCGANLSSQYLLVELLTALLFVFVFHFTSFTNNFFPSIILTSLLIVISFIDIKYFLIPNKLIIIGLGLGFFAHLISPTIGWLNILWGFLVGGGLLFLLAVLSKGGVGGGDIKLTALIGFYVGWHKVLLALFLAALFGSIVGLILLGLKRMSRKDPIPFGPFLALGTMVTFIV